MATTLVPAANTSLKSFAYDSGQYQQHLFSVATVGVPDVSSSGGSSGNGTFILFQAPCNCYVYQTTYTVGVVGTGAGSTLTVYKLAANNGSNLTSNIAVGNVVTIGVNVAGNIYSTGPYTYNVNSATNLSASSSNTAFAGGIKLLTGDLLITGFTGNTGVIAAMTEYSISTDANLTA